MERMADFQRQVVKLLEEFANNLEKMDDPTQKMQDQASLEAWTDLYKLFRLPYFGRRWIVQEIASASAPHVMMGGSEVAEKIKKR